MKKKLLALLLAVVMLLSLAVPALADGADDVDGVDIKPFQVPADIEGAVVILHSNDVHGAIDGYAKMAEVKRAYEAAGAEVYVMDAGDFIQGENYVSVSQGKTAVELMNMVGYVCAAPGNHEFDYGYENLKALQEEADFPILAANLGYEGDTLLGHADYKVIETKAGVKLGVFGLDTPETATKAHPAKIKGVTFAGGEEMYAVAQNYATLLKETEGADVVICLGHLGIDDESAVNGNRSVDLLEKVNGIDVFVDGHSHSTLADLAAKIGEDRTVGGTVVTSTGTKFANIGVITVKDGKITTDCVDANTVAIPADDPIAARAGAIEDEIKALYGATFATSEVKLNGAKAPGNRTEETNNGDLITDAMLWCATKEDLGVPTENVVAITNGGGIRAAIGVGDVSKNDVHEVLPFGNTVAVVYVTGAVLREVLEASTFCTPNAVGGFPQAAGIEFTIDTSAQYDAGDNYPGTTYAAPASINRVTVNSVNGKDLDLEATYAVVTNDFVAAGGDTYYALSTSDRITDTGVSLDEALMQYITEVLDGVIPADKYAQPQGRIHVKYVGVDGSAWYANAAKDVMDKGLMTGTQNGFEPEGKVNRATVFQILYNMEGKPEINNKMATFPDAQGKWYENAARWAEQAELTTGTGNGFEGDKEITRMEIVTLLYRYSVSKGGGKDVNVNLASFADGAEVPEWAEAAMEWAVGNKIISGKNGTHLAYADTATRAEMAQIMSNFTSGEAPAQSDGTLTGKPASISKYGNVLTDITASQVAAAGWEVGDVLSATVGDQKIAIQMPYGTGYSNVDQGSEIMMLVDGYVQLAINRGDFATTYGVGEKVDGVYTVNDVAITLSLLEKAGYLEEMELRELDSKRTNNREDYASDEVFANFRAITVGDIAEGTLYRTASPIDTSLGRNTYADKLIEKAGVKTIVNMADCAKSGPAQEGYEGSYYSQQKVVYLNMGVDMYSEEALGDLKNALEFMAENPGPYAFHCLEGKDRAGYFAMLLEALMGADLRDIVADYMLSFENYYHVIPDSEQWSKIAESNIEKDVMRLTNTSDIFSAGDADLQAAAEDYVLNTIGLSAENLAALKANLSGK